MILFLFLFLFQQQNISSLNPGTETVYANGGTDVAPVNILFFGDSITAGYGIDQDQAFPALIQSKADSAGLNIRAINAGLSGETSSGGLRRIDWVLRQKIDILVLELGANDGLRGIDLDITKDNLQQIIDRARTRYPEIEIVIAGMQVPPNLGQDYTELFRTIFIDLASDNSAALIPFILEGVAGEPDLNLPDGIHPTPEGHRIMAETVWKVIEPVIVEKLQSVKRE